MGNNLLIKVLGYSALILFIGCIIFGTMYSCEKKKAKELEFKVQETSNLLASSQDTLKHYKSEDGLNKARILTLETYKVETLLELQAKDKNIQWLQSEVAKYKKELKKPGDGVIVIEGETKFDTTYVPIREEGEWGKKVITRGFTNDWINFSTTIRVDSTSIKLGVTNKYSLVLGTDKDGKSFADITNYNPYSTTKVLRTYQITDNLLKPKPKKWGIGVSAGYSFDGKQFKPAVLFGINRNIFVW